MAEAQSDMPVASLAAATKLDVAARTRIVEAAAQALEARYIFPEVGRQMADRIRSRNMAHAYDATTSDTFSRLLTDDLYAVSHDRHIHLASDEMPGPGGPPPHLIRTGAEPGPPPGTPGLRLNPGPPHEAPPPARVTEYRHLPGNLGYLRIDQMLPAENEKDSIVAAMASLAGSNALIIDLRHNGGGDPQMVAEICTYLFPAGANIHLNDFVGRDDPTPHASYTLPSISGGRFTGPVYLLTSHATFSGGEEMAYDLQALKRAAVVGETTGGGANPGGTVPLPGGFSIFIPTGRPINPITGTNWEGVGVQPDVDVVADKALPKAELLAIQKLLAGTMVSPQAREEMREALPELERLLQER